MQKYKNTICSSYNSPKLTEVHRMMHHRSSGGPLLAKWREINIIHLHILPT